MAQTLKEQFNAATTLEDKANVLANYILTYRKKTRPGSLRISECIFETGLSKEDKGKLFESVRQKVVGHLAYDYPEIDSTNFQVHRDDLDALARSFDRKYLSTKKWQSRPTLFSRNIFPGLNLLKKYPIRFANELGSIGDVPNDSKIQISEINNNTIISNSTSFYYNPEEQLLFSTVTSISFDRVDGSTYFGTDLSKIPTADLLNEENFTRQLDICTYLIPKGNPDRSINILRYDGSGFDHYNQVFRSEKHKEVIGEIAKVPHFHFQNPVENLIYLKKEKNDATDKEYSNAGCNAIDCEHLCNYLTYLDGLSEEDLMQESTYGMPFLEAKRNGLVLNIDASQILNNYVLSMDPKKLTSQTMLFVSRLYKELSNVTGEAPSSVENTPPNVNDPNSRPTGGNLRSRGKFRLSDYKSFRDLTQKTGEIAQKSFDSLVVAIDMLDKIHAQQEVAKNPDFKMQLMALEAVCANAVVGAISCAEPKKTNTPGQEFNPNGNGRRNRSGKTTKSDERKKDPMGV